MKREAYQQYCPGGHGEESQGLPFELQLSSRHGGHTKRGHSGRNITKISNSAFVLTTLQLRQCICIKYQSLYKAGSR